MGVSFNTLCTECKQAQNNILRQKNKKKKKGLLKGAARQTLVSGNINKPCYFFFFQNQANKQENETFLDLIWYKRFLLPEKLK